MAEESLDAGTKEKTEAEIVSELLLKEKLSDEEKKRISSAIKADSKILTSEALTQALGGVNLAAEMNDPAKLSEALNKSSDFVKKTSQVLKNLDAMTKEGLIGSVRDNNKEKSPTAYLLDNARLSNGELVGTQMAKNLYVLNTATKSNEDPSFNANKDGLMQQRDEQAALFKQMYAKDGYGANSARANAAGQKVSDVMNMSVAQNSSHPNQKATELNNVVFMKNPVASMSIDDINSLIYQGRTLTADQMAVKQDADKQQIADLENQDGDKKKEKPQGGKTGFKEGDIMDYMYNEWFLAGCAWLMDKTEEALITLGTNSINYRKEQVRSYMNAASAAAGVAINMFSKNVDQQMGNRSQEMTNRKNNYTKLFDDVRHNIDNPSWPNEKQNPELKGFIKDIREKGQVDDFKNFLKSKPEETIGKKIDTFQMFDKLSAEVTKNEMIADVTNRNKTGSWIRATDGSGLTMDKFNKKNNERTDKLREAYAIVGEDTRIQSAAEWDTGKLDPDYVKAGGPHNKKAYMQYRAQQEQNKFTQDLTDTVSKAAKVADGKEVSKAFDKFVDNKINRGKFMNDLSNATVKSEVNLLDAARHDKSPEELTSSMEKNQALQADLGVRKIEVQNRKNKLAQFKDKINLKHIERKGKENPLDSLIQKKAKDQGR